MKTSNFLIAAAAISSLAFQSCSDDFNNKTTLPEGTEIRFGATLSDADGTRTYYGPEETFNDQRVWPIYWNYGATMGLDEIFIYSPQGATGRNQAKYRVEPEEKGQSTASKIVRLGEFGIQTSDASEYNFYALYPAKYVTGEATGTTISGTLPGLQNCTYLGYKSGTGNISENGTLPTAAGGDRTYVMKPNMDYCLMTGKNVGAKLTENPVSIQFSPFSSVLNITVNGPETNTTTGETTARITSVIVEANAPITGDFSVDFSGDPQKPTFKAGANASNSLTIEVRATDSDGDDVGIPLMSGNKLNLQAFILPNPAVTSLKVRVVTNDSRYWQKTLNMKGFAPKQIHPVKLPTINLTEGKLDYSIWLSQLDPRIYVSELSLPGSAASFSYYIEDKDGDNKDLRQQTKTLTEQFEAGIRVFQSHAWIQDQISAIDGGKTSICINVNETPVKKSDGTYLALGDVVKELTNEMATRHADEFCVLILSDYKCNTYSQNDFLNRLKTALNSPEMQKYVVTDFGPNTTIGDIKGKILVKVAVNSEAANSGILAGTNALFNLWESNSSNQVNYSSLQWAKAQGLTNSANPSTPSATNMLYIHAEQSNPILSYNGSISWNEYYGIDQTNAFHNNYDSSTHNIFGMTYLGGKGEHYTTKSGWWPNQTTTYHYFTPTQVADRFNKKWIDQVAQWTGDNNKKPYGWILMNSVGGTFTNAAYSTEAVITKVISQNNDNNFKLNRDRSQKQNAPNGDIKAPKPGGSLF